MGIGWTSAPIASMAPTAARGRHEADMNLITAFVEFLLVYSALFFLVAALADGLRAPHGVGEPDVAHRPGDAEPAPLIQRKIRHSALD